MTTYDRKPTLRLSSEDWAEVVALAVKNGRTPTQEMRVAIREHLARGRKK